MTLLNSQEKTEDTPAFDWRTLPSFVDLHTYWQSIRRDNVLPHAEDFDPLAIVPLLSEISLLDLISPEKVMWRFAGTGITERLGQDVTGANMFDMQPKSTRLRARHAYQTITNHPCGMIARYTNHYSTGFQAVVSTLYLPLFVKSQGIHRLLGIGHREQKTEYAAPINETLMATDVISVDWLDIGFGVPASTD